MLKQLAQEKPQNVATEALGFTLTELLVVLLIIALAISIAVPAIMGGRNQRVLVASASRLSSDIQWAMTEAKKSGTNIYLAFKYDFSRDEILGHEAGPAGTVFDRDDPTYLNGRFRPPDNPGVQRIATGYYLVQEQPRFWSTPQVPSGNIPSLELPAEATPYTYLDFLNELDKFLSDPNTFFAPKEPQYPFDPGKTAARGGAVSGSNVNRASVPRIFYPLAMDSPSSTYYASFIGDAFESGSLDLSLPERQPNKVFCVADRDEILLYDRYDPSPADGVRTYEPGVDHPRLIEQIYDYILLREVDLPKGVYLINPWKNLFPVGENPRVYADFQFLQFIYRISPDGSFRVYEWTYDPEPFPDNTTTGLVHGHLSLRLSTPDFIYFFLIIDEVVNPEENFNIMDTRRAQNEDSGRVITVWPLNSRVTIDPYAPNDSSRPMTPDDDLWNPYQMRFLDKPQGAQYPYNEYY